MRLLWNISADCSTSDWQYVAAEHVFQSILCNNLFYLCQFGGAGLFPKGSASICKF